MKRRVQEQVVLAWMKNPRIGGISMSDSQHWWVHTTILSAAIIFVLWMVFR